MFNLIGLLSHGIYQKIMRYDVQAELLFSLSVIVKNIEEYGTLSGA